MDGQSLWEQVNDLFDRKQYEEVESLLMANEELAKSNRELLKIFYLIPVCATEREEGQQTLFSKVSGVDELLERDTKVKFYLRRIAFDVLDDEDEFCEFCHQNHVSLPELFIEAYCNAVHKEKVQAFIQRKIAEGKLEI
ncbi:MAG: hypothetical protein HDR06_10965 [Lachnospiraceae bacterium]|nr:hypothetical protein [Lachnospiraceae bacterium]